MLNSCVLTGNLGIDPEILIFNSCESNPVAIFISQFDQMGQRIYTSANNIPQNRRFLI